MNSNINMEVMGLTGSPNWFATQVVDYSAACGVIAAGTNCRILLLSVNEAGHSITHSAMDGSFEGYLSGSHRLSDRVNAVAFGRKQHNGHLLVSGGTEGMVFLWDVDARTCIGTYDFHKGAAVSSVAFPLIGNSHVDTVFAADTKGKVSMWIRNSGDIKSCAPLQDEIYCIAVNLESVVAIGYKSGTIVTATFEGASPSVVHRFTGHKLEVQCISWVPKDFSTNVLGLTGYVLCSSAKDKTCRLWTEFSDEAIVVWSLPAPVKKPSGTQTRDWERIWFTHAWVGSSCDSLVSTTYSGGLLRWSFSGCSVPMAKASPYTGRPQAIFSICCLTSSSNKAVSISSDRQIITWDTGSLKPLCKMPTIGGHVYDCDISPLDGVSIAVACGDSTIRVWQSDSSTSYNCRSLGKGISCRVHCVSWHPVDEGLLAYGLDDGSVGVYDMLKNSSVLAKAKHPQTVTKLQWLSFRASSSQPFLALCSLGEDGTIWCHKNLHIGESQDLVDVVAEIEKTRPDGTSKSKASSFSWNSAGFLAVGKQDGTVEITTSELIFSEILYGHRKSVTALAWQCKPKLLLASGSSDGTISVVDLSRTGVRLEACKFSQHSGQITSLDWSLHDEELLLSSSHDNSVQVWDTKKKVPLSSFRGHAGKVLVARWSLLDSNVVFSGSTDQSILSWMWRNLPHVTPPRKKDQVRKTNTRDRDSQAGSNAISNAKDVGQAARKDRKQRSLLPFCGGLKQLPVAQSQEQCFRLVRRRTNPDHLGDGDLEIGLHVDRNLAVATIRHEQHKHAENEQHTAHGILCMWEGRLLDALNSACQNRNLTQQLVAMSPQAGRDVWLKVSHVYAQQLAEAGDIHGASTNFLQCGEVMNAIEVYEKAGNYSEAVSIARLRLAPTDPKLQSLYKGWAQQAEKQNCFELAAKCYLAIDEDLAAVHALASRGGLRGLQCGYELGIEVGVTMNDLASRLVVEKRKIGDWEYVWALLNTHEDMKVHRPALVVEAVLFKKFPLVGGPKAHSGQENLDSKDSNDSSERDSVQENRKLLSIAISTACANSMETPCSPQVAFVREYEKSSAISKNLGVLSMIVDAWQMLQIADGTDQAASSAKSAAQCYGSATYDRIQILLGCGLEYFLCKRIVSAVSTWTDLLHMLWKTGSEDIGRIARVICPHGRHSIRWLEDAVGQDGSLPKWFKPLTCFALMQCSRNYSDQRSIDPDLCDTGKGITSSGGPKDISLEKSGMEDLAYYFNALDSYEGHDFIPQQSEYLELLKDEIVRFNDGSDQLQNSEMNVLFLEVEKRLSSV